MGLILYQLVLILSPILGMKHFPKDFKFGTATASYQIEGGWNADGKGENIWDHICHTDPNFIYNHNNGDIACDSYHKWYEDVEMLKNLTVNHYRFSLSWSRILPTGATNHINQAGVDYYNNLIDALLANGIEPFITLYHWDLPQPLQDIGGWPNPILEQYFVDYAILVFSLYGDRVRNWMTFNEPKQTCHLGYGDGLFAPAIASPGIGEYLCSHTIIKAHASVYHIYDKNFRPVQNGRISIVIDTTWYEPENDSPASVEAAERALQFNYGWFANPIYSRQGNYPQIMIDRIYNRSLQEGYLRSRLPEFTQDEIDYIRGTYDFLALNTYTTNLVKWRPDDPIGTPSWSKDMSITAYFNESWPGSASEWLKVVPWGARKLLNWIHHNYDQPEIIITENGFSDHGELEDYGRINYYSQYLRAILDAKLEDGVNITGYTAWSLMDNFEWTSGYSQHFGLHFVDFNDPQRPRTIKKSGEYFKTIIKSRCLVDICED